MSVFDCRDESVREEAVSRAVAAIGAGELVVIPTDTVYGIAADAFNPVAVQRLLDAKGRGRTMPPPVLIGSPATLEALSSDVQPWLRNLVGEFWPGPLTVICHAQPSLSWDLGDTRGTVAVRVPDHAVTAAVLKNTGPLAVSSANLHTKPPSDTAAAAAEQFGDVVAVYLEMGSEHSGLPSTILDAASSTPQVLREGAVTLDDLHQFNNTIRPLAQAEGTGIG